MRSYERAADGLRPVHFTVGYCEYPAGSVLVETGKTRVLCNASVELRVPPHVNPEAGGWVTAEYAMLPAATATRNRRDISSLKLNGRAAEIQRLIGRSLRSVTDLSAMPGMTVTLDCDVLQADGGTRTASVTGGWLALWLACEKCVRDGLLPANPVREELAAVSAGVVNGTVLLDLDYSEDSRAECDFNMILTPDGRIIELQGTGEQRPFTREELAVLLDYGTRGVQALCAARRAFMR